MSVLNHTKENIFGQNLVPLLKNKKPKQNVDKDRKILISIGSKNEKMNKSKIQNDDKVHNFHFFRPVDLGNFRKITSRKQRQRVLRKYVFLQRFFNCKSKTQMVTLFMSIPESWKPFLTFYLSRCFVMHLLVRQIKKYQVLFRYRQTLLEALDNPDLIKNCLPFTSNLIKNFCKGLCNFVFMFYEDLVDNGFIPRSGKGEMQDRIS